MSRTMLLIGCGLCFFGVALGAFGAHVLRDHIPPDRIGTWDIGVRYQLVHGLALFGFALAMDRWPEAGWGRATWPMLIGTVLFSGSLYWLALSAHRAVALVTPLGGLLLLTGWAAAGLAAFRSTSRSSDSSGSGPTDVEE